MTSIAVLGWGSLIWDRRSLGIESKWFVDGPCLPIEFARKSDGMRATLVVFPGYHHSSRSYWARSSFGDVGSAAENLRSREGTPTLKPIHCADHESWGSVGDGKGPKDEIGSAVANWVTGQDGIDVAIWTGLGWKSFNPPSDRVTLEDQVIGFLRSLDPDEEEGACEYIRKAPASIDTPVRQAIERELKWKRKPLDPGLFEREEPGQPCS